MVKPIKKRVPKSKRDDQSASEVEGAEDGPEHMSEEQSGELPGELPGEQDSTNLIAEIQGFANDESADRFSEVVEGFFLSLADNVVVLVILGLLGIGAYGFVQYNEGAELEGLVKGRALIEQGQERYQELLRQEATALKARAAAASSNPLGLSIAPQGESAQGPDAAAYKSVSQRFAKIKSGLSSQPLAELATTSSAFDAAETSAEYAETARLFNAIGTDDTLEIFVRGIALKNAAIAHEEAARVATEGQSASHWSDAAAAWARFGALQDDVFGLNAKLNRARVLRMSGDLDGALKAYQAIESAYAQSSDRKRVTRDVKIGRALISGAQAEAAAQVQAETPKAETPKAETPKAETPKTK